ncbi:RHS repeat domain-containing protein [Planctomycetota bacterium]
MAQHDGDQSDTIYYYLHDRLGSVRLLIDATGNVKKSYTFDPFGNLLEYYDDGGNIENSYLFTGQFFDNQINQYYLRARQYDPSIQRFTSIDPVRGNFQEPLTLHQYLYCLNNPVNRWDPDGQISYNLPDISVTSGIQKGMQGWGYYDTAHTFGGYISQIIAGASISSLCLTIAIDVGMDVAGGKFFDLFAGAGSTIMRKIKKGNFRGGPHGLTKGPKGDMLDSHHMPAKSTYDMDEDLMPAIQMDRLDHKNTRSYGYGSEAIEYREALSELIGEGDFRDAMAMDILDVRRVAREGGNPRKYNEAIREMLNYAYEMGLLYK